MKEKHNRMITMQDGRDDIIPSLIRLGPFKLYKFFFTNFGEGSHPIEGRILLETILM